MGERGHRPARPPRSGTDGKSAKATAKGKAGEVGRTAQKVRHNRTFRSVARVGLGSRALVYLLVGGLIIEIAVRGRASSPADTAGAFSEVARQPGGTGILVVLASGLFAYALWRVVEALSRTPEGQGVSAWTLGQSDARQISRCCVGGLGRVPRWSARAARDRSGVCVVFGPFDDGSLRSPNVSRTAGNTSTGGHTKARAEEQRRKGAVMGNAAKGKVDRMKGTVKAGAGRVTNNRSLERKGRNQKVKGNAKDAAAKTKNALSE